MTEGSKTNNLKARKKKIIKATGFKLNDYHKFRANRKRDYHTSRGLKSADIDVEPTKETVYNVSQSYKEIEAKRRKTQTPGKFHQT